MATNNAVNTYIVPTTANEVTQPSQPAFLGYLGAGNTDADVTGNAGLYQLGTTGNALTEVFDQNADFTAAGVFTAPVTGRHFLTGNLQFAEAGAGTGAAIWIFTTNRLYTFEDGCETNAAAVGSMEVSTLADMDAADTANLRGHVTGLGGNTVDVVGSATLVSYFSGNLVV